MRAARTLFTVDPQFTIDTCSFNEMFDLNRDANKKNFPGIWAGVEDMILKGRVISHREVYEEIMEGPYEDLKIWVRQHRDVFRPYDFAREGAVISDIGRRGFISFVHQGKTSYNADPWLIAQAKLLKLRIITQEKKKQPRDLPRICDEFTINYLDIAALVREKGWVLDQIVV